MEEVVVEEVLVEEVVEEEVLVEEVRSVQYQCISLILQLWCVRSLSHGQE